MGVTLAGSVYCISSEKETTLPEYFLSFSQKLAKFNVSKMWESVSIKKQDAYKDIFSIGRIGEQLPVESIYLNNWKFFGKTLCNSRK